MISFFISILVSGFLSETVFAADIGFSSGNIFQTIPVHGQVTVYCPDSSNVTYTCRDVVLDPANYDYFVGPSGVSADKVTLSCLRPDGSSRAKDGGYDSSLGRSKDAFNLWISTLFQKALLQVGTNKVSYFLSEDGKKVAQGNFVVKVTQSAPRECPTTHYNSPDMVDCQSQYTVCQRYFEQYQNCR